MNISCLNLCHKMTIQLGLLFLDFTTKALAFSTDIPNFVQCFVTSVQTKADSTELENSNICCGPDISSSRPPTELTRCLTTILPFWDWKWPVTSIFYQLVTQSTTCWMKTMICKILTFLSFTGRNSCTYT